ncbi:MAG: hypothetical protein GF353_14905, partial [Candidatus Lokiarchaeota archaeon]|nr:hypothetical protein [Candidatus Lokiarchaeota archaeon]
MRIIKFTHGFVTNHSSDHMVIVLGVRKGKDLRKELEKICEKNRIPKKLIPDFEKGLDLYSGEIDHLIAEYDFYYSEPSTLIYQVDNYYQMLRDEFRNMVKLIENIP